MITPPHTAAPNPNRTERDAVMPRPELVTKADLERAIAYLSGRFGREPSTREIAGYLSEKLNQPVRENYVTKVKMRHGLNKPQLSHRDYIPWLLMPEDTKSKEAQYLRVLGALAQEENRPAVAINKAGNWARAIVEEGLDVRYVALNPVGERWEYFPANPDSWHLKQVLTAALEGLARLSE